MVAYWRSNVRRAAAATGAGAFGAVQRCRVASRRRPSHRRYSAPASTAARKPTGPRRDGSVQMAGCGTGPCARVPAPSGEWFGYCAWSSSQWRWVRWAMRMACAKFEGSIDGELRAGRRRSQDENDRSDKSPSHHEALLRSESSRLRSRIRRKIQVARDVHLHPVPFANRDRRQAIQKPTHDLQARLRCGVGAARDDDRAVAVAIRRSQQCRCTAPGR